MFYNVRFVKSNQTVNTIMMKRNVADFILYILLHRLTPTLPSSLEKYEKTFDLSVMLKRLCAFTGFRFKVIFRTNSKHTKL